MRDITPELVQQLAPTGRLRAAINLGNVVLAARDRRSGELRGVSVELTRELANRLGVAVELEPFDTAAHAFTALESRACDLGFLAIDPERAEVLDYTPPYVVIEGTYLVAEASPLHAVEDVDQAGVRIAAGKNTAYDLHLSRTLRQAQLVHYPSSSAAIDALLAGETDAAAGVRQALAAGVAGRTGFRVMAGRFLSIEQAMTLPKGRPAAHALLCAFIEEMKASGFVADALARSGQAEAAVAGAVDPGRP